MKKRNQERVAKIFALVVILIMIFQVLLPLFNSVTTNSTATTASVTAAPDTTQPVDATVETAPAQPVTVTTSPETKITATPVAPAATK